LVALFPDLVTSESPEVMVFAFPSYQMLSSMFLGDWSWKRQRHSHPTFRPHRLSRPCSMTERTCKQVRRPFSEIIKKNNVIMTRPKIIIVRRDSIRSKSHPVKTRLKSPSMSRRELSHDVPWMFFPGVAA
jgi:hypothetical protein